MAIREGMTDFLTELATGKNPSDHIYQWAKPQERAICQDFKQDMNEAEPKGWLQELPKRSDRTADLGYYARKYVKKYLVDPTYAYLLCPKGEQLIGYSFLSINKSRKRIGYIHELFVTDSQRGQKIGLLLGEESLKWLDLKDRQQVNLTVNRHNVSATSLYKKLGLQVTALNYDYVDMSVKMG